MKTLITLATALCIALGMSAAHNLDEETAAALAHQKQEKQQQTTLARFEKAAQSICGDNAGWRLDGITLTCTTKRGFVTQKVAIQ